jgi:hypothetical protein
MIGVVITNLGEKGPSWDANVFRPHDPEANNPPLAFREIECLDSQRMPLHDVTDGGNKLQRCGSIRDFGTYRKGLGGALKDQILEPCGMSDTTCS